MMPYHVVKIISFFIKLCSTHVHDFICIFSYNIIMHFRLMNYALLGMTAGDLRRLSSNLVLESFFMFIKCTQRNLFKST